MVFSMEQRHLFSLMGVALQYDVLCTALHCLWVKLCLWFKYIDLDTECKAKSCVCVTHPFTSYSHVITTVTINTEGCQGLLTCSNRNLYSVFSDEAELEIGQGTTRSFVQKMGFLKQSPAFSSLLFIMAMKDFHQCYRNEWKAVHSCAREGSLPRDKLHVKTAARVNQALWSDERHSMSGDEWGLL